MKTSIKNQILAFALSIATSFFLASPATAQTPTVLHSFAATPNNNPFTNADGAFPEAPLILSGNTLYGTAKSGGSAGDGTVFAVNTNGTGFTNLHSFSGADGYQLLGGLVLSGNTLYGTSSQGGGGSGTVFAINTNGGDFTTLYVFTNSEDGSAPECALVLSGGILYGTTSSGGSSNNGTIFAINTNGTGFTNLYSFKGSNDGANPGTLIISGNTLYGTASSTFISSNKGAIFAINTDGTGFTVLHTFPVLSKVPVGVEGAVGTNYDGANPGGPLLLLGGTLYGTAGQGGGLGIGTLFSINTNGTGFTVLDSFTAPTNFVTGPNTTGAQPNGGLVLVSNLLYGTGIGGGTYGNGAVFAVGTNGSGLISLYSFGVTANGLSPIAGLTASGNTLYGTTSQGGAAGFSGGGTVFSLTPGSGSSSSAPTILDEPVSASVLEGNKATFSVTAQGSGLHYKWFKGATALAGTTRITGVTNSTLTISDVATTDAGSYSVTITNSLGKATSSVVTLTVEVPVVITTKTSTPEVGEITGGGDYTSGSQVTVSIAQTNGCYAFTGWSVTGSSKIVSTNANYTFTAKANETVTANFSEYEYVIKTVSNPAGGGTTTGAGTKACGSAVKLTEAPAAGFKFQYWSSSAGVLVVSNLTLSFSAEASATFTANFLYTNLPTLTISSPASNTKTTNPAVTVKGTATDKAGISAVNYSLNGSSWTEAQPASGTNWSTWVAAVTLASGTNIFSAQAVDTAGNISKTSSIDLIYNPPAAKGSSGSTPASLSGLVGQVTGGGESPSQISFGDGTFAIFSTDTNQDTGVGLYTYTQIESNIAVVALHYLAPPSEAGNGASSATLFFTNASTAIFTNDNGEKRVLTFSTAKSSAPESIIGVTAFSSDTNGYEDTNIFGYGTFSSHDNQTNADSGNYTYTRFTPMAALLVQTFTDPAKDVGYTNYLLLDFSDTNAGNYRIESDNATNATSYEDSGAFSFLNSTHIAAEFAPLSLNGMNVTVTPDGQSPFAASFGLATIGQFSTNDPSLTSGVGTYTYTPISTNTAQLVIDITSPPLSTNQGGDVFLYFTSAGGGQFSSGDNTGTFSLTSEASLAPASLVGATITATRGSVTDKITFTDYSFTESDRKDAGTYIYQVYGPSTALIIFSTATCEDAGEAKYTQLTFSSSTKGVFYDTDYYPTGTSGTDSGTFTLTLP